MTSFSRPTTSRSRVSSATRTKVGSTVIRKGALSTLLYLLLVSPSNAAAFAETFGSPPLDGKVLVNSESGFSGISFPQAKGVLAILRGLALKEDEHQKAWFIEDGKIFQEKNLRIFYMPFASLERIVKSKNFAKMPDPLGFLAGITLNFAALAKARVPSPPNKRVNFKITKPARKTSNEHSYENRQPDGWDHKRQPGHSDKLQRVLQNPPQQKRIHPATLDPPGERFKRSADNPAREIAGLYRK